MNYPTFKEHLTLLEARRDTAKYTEKQAKGVLDKVTAVLSGTESASMTKLARRYARLEASMKKMKEEHEALNTRLKDDVQGYFAAEDLVLTRVVETAQFTLTMAKEIQKPGGTASVDYEKIIAALSALIPDELQARVEMITEKYTTIVPNKPPIKRLSVSKEVVKEGVLAEGLLEKAKAFLKSITSWATRFDGKLAKLKKQAGMVTESTIAHYDEKERQRKASALTVANVMKKLNASTLPQATVEKFGAGLKGVEGELTAAKIKDILKAAKIGGDDADEIMDLLG